MEDLDRRLKEAKSKTKRPSGSYRKMSKQVADYKQGGCKSIGGWGVRTGLDNTARHIGIIPEGGTLSTAKRQMLMKILREHGAFEHKFTHNNREVHVWGFKDPHLQTNQS